MACHAFLFFNSTLTRSYYTDLDRSITLAKITPAFFLSNKRFHETKIFGHLEKPHEPIPKIPNER